jgi:glycolate oxidase
MTRIIEKVKHHGAVTIQEAKTPADRDKLWAARRQAYGVFAKIAPDILSEDITVPVSKVPEMTRRIREICTRHNIRVGILAHAGDGNMHPLIPADRNNHEEWTRVIRAFGEIFEAAAALHGTLSGEHGIGMAKAAYLPLVMDDDSREFMTVIKRAVDPENILNPGKFV